MKIVVKMFVGMNWFILPLRPLNEGTFDRESDWSDWEFCNDIYLGCLWGWVDKKKRINIFVKHLDINKIVSIFAARKEIEWLWEWGKDLNWNSSLVEWGSKDLGIWG